MIGIPQPNILSRVLKARLCFCREKFGIEEGEYLNFDAIRQTFYCGSHGLRGGAKNSILVLADKRFDSGPKRDKFPMWALSGLKNSISASTDMVKNASLKFLRSKTN